MPQGTPTRRYGDDSVTSFKLSVARRQGLYVFERCDHQPSLSAPNGYGDPTGTTGDINRALFRHGLYTQYHVKGTQTLLGPLLSNSLYLDVSQDQTDNDGVEHVFGALGVVSPFVFTTPAYGFIEIKLDIADVSGSDDLAIGFRKNEAFQAAIDSYDEAAFVNVILGDISVESILNNATTVTTDSGENWTDGQTKTVRVELDGRRVSYYVDDEPLPGIPEFNFDTGEVVVPFFYFLQATTSPGLVHWQHVAVGKSSETTSTGNNN
jgi:hypothetical protein